MSEPGGPYRKERTTAEVIPRDTRLRDRLLLIGLSAAIGAGVATTTTVYVLRRPTTSVAATQLAESNDPRARQTVTELPAPVAPAVTCHLGPPLDSPSGVPLVVGRMPRPPGAVLRRADHGTGQESISLETCDTVEQVIAFYRTNGGFNWDAEEEIANGRALRFQRYLADRAETTTVSVTRWDMQRRIDVSSISTPRTTPDPPRRRELAAPPLGANKGADSRF